MNHYHRASADHQMAQLLAASVFYQLRNRMPFGVRRVIVTADGRTLTAAIFLRWWALLLAPILCWLVRRRVRWQMDRVKIWMEIRVNWLARR